MEHHPNASKLDFDNTHLAFSYKSDAELKRTYSLFKKMDSRFLTRVGPPLVAFALKIGLPLEGIILRDTTLTITLGGDISHHRRIVIDAARVSVQQTAGVDEGVAIESTDGHTTRLRFRSPMPPELVDGVAP